MTVFPEKIVLKSSDDSEIFVKNAIRVGGTDEIQAGELVVLREDARVRIFALDANSEVQAVSGLSGYINELDDVNTETGELALGKVLGYDGTEWVPTSSSGIRVIDGPIEYIESYGDITTYPLAGQLPLVYTNVPLMLSQVE